MLIWYAHTLLFSFYRRDNSLEIYLVGIIPSPRAMRHCYLLIPTLLVLCVCSSFVGLALHIKTFHQSDSGLKLRILSNALYKQLRKCDVVHRFLTYTFYPRRVYETAFKTT